MRPAGPRVSLAEAVRRVTEDVARLEAESIEAEEALDRISAEPVFASHAAPHYRAAAMDGLAVRAAETSGASGESPVFLRTLERPSVPGELPPQEAPAGTCLPVDTGDPLPDWADAVVRIEEVRAGRDGHEVLQAVFAGKDVREAGEDIEASARLVPRGHRFAAYDIGACLATGVAHVEVVRRPRLASLCTGGEIVEPGGRPRAGRVIEFNARVLAAQAATWGARTDYLGCIGDRRETLRDCILSATADHDLVCVMAGSSVGRKDFTVEVLRDCGDLLVHGVQMMPGHPAAAALVAGVPVFAVPGYPVSAVVVYRELIVPVLARMLGTAPPRPDLLTCTVLRDVASRTGVEEFLRVCVREDGTPPIAAPLARGAGSIGSLVEADGLLRVPAACEGIEVGSEVEIELLVARPRLAGNLLVAGRRDRWSAGLEDRLRLEDPSCRLRYLGRAGREAVLAVQSGEAHLAVFPADAGGQEAAGQASVHAPSSPALRTIEAGDRLVLAGEALAQHPCGRRLLALARDCGSA